MAILLHTGVLLAAADNDDAQHQRCAELLRARRGELQVPAPVISETAWQIERNLGPRSEAAFLRLITGEHLHVIDLTLPDWARGADLIEQCEDLHLGLVDASVVAVAERLNIATIATIDHRDFTVVRPAHTNTFELIP